MQKGGTTNKQVVIPSHVNAISIQKSRFLVTIQWSRVRQTRNNTMKPNNFNDLLCETATLLLSHGLRG